MLVLYYTGILFFKKIFFFLGHVPTTANIWWHSTQALSMTLYGESAETKAGIYFNY